MLVLDYCKTEEPFSHLSRTMFGQVNSDAAAALLHLCSGFSLKLQTSRLHCQELTSSAPSSQWSDLNIDKFDSRILSW